MTLEDVLEIMLILNMLSKRIVRYGGQTPLKLVKDLWNLIGFQFFRVSGAAS